MTEERGNIVNIVLNITLEGGGKGAREVASLYAERIAGDIDQTAWNLCDESDERQAREFGNVSLENYDVNTSNGNIKIKATISALVTDESFVTHVMNEYMDGFSDAIKSTQLEYKSRTGRQSMVDLEPGSWDIEVTPKI